MGLESLSGDVRHAADVDNDGSISISDVVQILRDIVGLESISSFDLVSTAGSRITDFSPSMLETDLYLIQNDDADLSGGLIIA